MKMKNAIKISEIIILIILMLSLSACSNVEEEKIESLEKEISYLEEESREQNIIYDNLIEENSELQNELDNITQNIEINEWNIENKYHHIFDELSPINLTELNPEEMELYEEFSNTYDIEVLRGSSPIVITKMYIYASFIGDYETAYELYVTDENYVLFSKDEYIESSQGENEKYDNYLEAYNLYVKYYDSDGACLFWAKDQETLYEIHTLYYQIFHLTKEDGIWRVDYLPIQ